MAGTIRTSDIAAAVGVHPNTVRLYEEWGYLPHIPRSTSGYRLFTQAHLEQMILARLALDTPWAGKTIRASAAGLVRRAASGDMEGALVLARRHLLLVQAEQAQAEAASAVLEQWAVDPLGQRLIKQEKTGRNINAAVDLLPGQDTPNPKTPLPIGRAAALLDVSPDRLRNWERNGLLTVPRNPRNGYRQYGTAEIGRLRIIRLLLRAGYSMMAVLRMVQQLDQGRREGLREVLDTPRPDEEILFATDRWLSTLARQEKRAREIIARLAQMAAGRS